MEGTGGDSERKRNIVNSLRSFVRRGDLREGVLKLVVKGPRGDTGRISTVDLLKDQLISTKKILRQGSRTRGSSLNFPVKSPGMSRN